MYRSASLTLAPRSDSPRSTRSAPYPAGVAASGGGGSVLNRSSRGESPRSVRSAAPAPDSHSYRVSRRTSSVDSQSSVDSRGHRRYGEHFAFDSVFCYYFFTPMLYIYFSYLRSSHDPRILVHGSSPLPLPQAPQEPRQVLRWRERGQQ